MYCPSCGKTNSSEQKFCRSCGLNLEEIGQSLAKQAPAEELNQRLQAKRRKVERLINILAGGTISILVLAVLWGIIYEIIIVKGAVLGGSIFLSFFVGLILFTVLVIYRESVLKASGERQAVPHRMPEVGDTARFVPDSSIESLPAVTDRTTELMVKKSDD